MTDDLPIIPLNKGALVERNQRACRIGYAKLHAMGLLSRVRDDDIAVCTIFDEPDHAAKVNEVRAQLDHVAAGFQVVLTDDPEIGEITILLVTPRAGATADDIITARYGVSVPRTEH